MTEHIPPSMGWIFWDKDASGDFSDGELAYTSFNRALKKVKITWMGMRQYDMSNKEIRIHPTQKPVALYKWLLKNYANPCDKILDTHIGSGSIAIAVDSMNKVEGMNLTLTGCELDPDYYADAMKRIKTQTAQQSLFQ
jgi:site-specific DNA-methyltransferase (adenine-specific)